MSKPSVRDRLNSISGCALAGTAVASAVSLPVSVKIAAALGEDPDEALIRSDQIRSERRSK